MAVPCVFGKEWWIVRWKLEEIDWLELPGLIVIGSMMMGGGARKNRWRCLFL